MARLEDTEKRHNTHMVRKIVPYAYGMYHTGADLGFIKGGGLTQGTNLLGRESMLELGGSGGMPPPGNF